MSQPDDVPATGEPKEAQPQRQSESAVAESAAPAAPAPKPAVAAQVLVAVCGGRARALGFASGLVGVLELVLAGLNMAGKSEGNSAIFLAPAALFNLVLAVLLTRVGAALIGPEASRTAPPAPLASAFDQLSKAFLVQIAAAVLLLVVLFASLLLAALSGRGGAS